MRRAIHLTNTLTRSKERFEPLERGVVQIYSCGPTVYDYAHIGNFRAFLTADLFSRLFRINGYAVRRIENITDIGHLTDDADEGRDKIEESARRNKKTARAIADMYTRAFLEDARTLNIKRPLARPKASEHIAEQIEFIRELEAAGYTYHTSDGVYFDTSLFSDYGKPSPQKREELLEGARIGTNTQKRNPTDFALWKFSPHNEKRHMEWQSPWGTGFPGWHIECSAMSRGYLGFPFDIHTGAIDLVPVHHTNEIAQNESVYGAPSVNYWLHNEFVTVEGEKMSKSLGNVFALEDMRTRGFDPLAYRYLVLNTHYRQPMNFTWQALESAEEALAHITEQWRKYEFIRKYASSWWERLRGRLASSHERSYMSAFFGAANDDLNTPQALAVLWEMLRDENLSALGKRRLLLMFDELFALLPTETVDIPHEVRDRAERRRQARTNKDWETADTLREEISRRGYAIDDTSGGYILYKPYKNS